jgi:hypothetical protein
MLLVVSLVEPVLEDIGRCGVGVVVGTVCSLFMMSDMMSSAPSLAPFDFSNVYQLGNVVFVEVHEDFHVLQAIDDGYQPAGTFKADGKVLEGHPPLNEESMNRSREGLESSPLFIPDR